MKNVQNDYLARSMKTEEREHEGDRFLCHQLLEYLILDDPNHKSNIH